MYKRLFLCMVGAVLAYAPSAIGQPAIATLSAPAGPTGTILTLTGLNFNPTKGQNHVRIGGVRAEETAATATQLRVRVPGGAASVAPVTVTDQSTGLTGSSLSSNTPFFNVTYPGGVVTPANYTRTDLNGVGTGAWQVAAADLNDDGWPDLAVANGAVKTVSVLYKTGGSAGFSTPLALPLRIEPRGLVAGDLNGDGRIDLAAASFSQDSVAVLLQNAGNTGFAAPVYLKLPPNPQATANLSGVLTAGDFNGDGRADLAVGGGQAVYVFERSADNSGYGAPVTLPGSGVVIGLATGDFNGDGKLDLASGTWGGTAFPNYALFYRNAANDGFEPAVKIDAGTGPTTLAAADFNRDGKTDLVGVHYNSGTASVLLRNAQNTGFDVTGFACGHQPTSLVTGDFNGDGKTDFAVGTDFFAGTDREGVLKIFTGNGSPASFNAPVDLPLGVRPYGLGTGDFNRDGRPDFAVGNAAATENNLSVLTYNNSVVVRLPVIHTANPTSGPAGTVVTVTGDFLKDAAQVTFNGTAASFTAVSDTLLTAVVPAGATAGPVVVTTPAGTATGTASFTVTTLPTFTDVGNTGLANVTYGATAWGDYDNDGDLDLLLMGTSGGLGRGALTRIYRNTKGTFTDIQEQNLVPVQLGSADWGDYDNDGDLDLVVTGSDSTFRQVTRIYRNTGGKFTDTKASLTQVGSGAAAWGDYDNDGDLDLVVTGMMDKVNNEAGTAISKLYENRNGTFRECSADLIGVTNSAVAWGDYDNDGDLDLALSGIAPNNQMDIQYVLKIYRNTGGALAELTSVTLPGSFLGSVAWGDYDNDGDLDLLQSGYGKSGAGPDLPMYANIYRNTDGTFADIKAGLTGVGQGTARWGDYDNDGRLDVFAVGMIGQTHEAAIYRNTGSAFEKMALPALVGLASATAAWGDYDSDGDLDLVAAGGGAWAPVFTKLYRNDATQANVPPAAPQALKAVVTGRNVALAWEQPTDNATPPGALSFAVRVGTKTNPVKVASPGAHPGTGYRRVVATGSAGLNDGLVLKNLQPGTYVWSVQAIDHSFAGSPFGPEGTFTIAGLPNAIAFEPVPDQSPGTSLVVLSAKATSGLPVAFEVVSGPAIVAGDTLWLGGAGTVTVRAVQAGDSAHYEAESVERTFCVGAAKPVVRIKGNRLFSSAAAGNQWLYNNQPIAGATDSVWVARQPGTYAVRVTGPCGGQVQVSDSVVVKAAGGGTQVAGIREIGAFGPVIYPNPTGKQFAVGLPEGQSLRAVQLYSLEGVLLKAWTGCYGGEPLYVTELRSGVYLVHLQTEAGTVRKKLFVQ